MASLPGSEFEERDGYSDGAESLSRTVSDSEELDQDPYFVGSYVSVARNENKSVGFAISIMTSCQGACSILYILMLVMGMVNRIGFNSIYAWCKYYPHNHLCLNIIITPPPEIHPVYAHKYGTDSIYF